MAVLEIERADDPRLADYAGAREPALLRRRGLLMAEGRFVVRRLLDSPRFAVRSLLLNDAAFHGLRDAVDRTDPRLEVYVAAPDVITGITGFHLHRGCLAVAERPAEPSPQTLLSTGRLIVGLERVVDADNVGSVFRNCEAFGVNGVMMSPGCCDPWYRKAIRTSSGAAFVVPFTTAGPGLDAAGLRSHGFVIAAATPDRSAVDIRDFVVSPAARGRVAVLFGTEGQGLTADTLAHADMRIRIPMSDALDSLNIATAAGIILHRLHEARRLAGERATPAR